MAMAQDIKVCEMCESFPVQMHCNSCAVSMCHGCVIKHISNDTEKDHNVVLYRKKNTKLILPYCKTHTQQNCEMKCQQCDVPVCVQCISSGVHKQHNISDLLNLCNSHKDIIKQKTSELETLTYPQYEKAVSDLQIQLQNLLPSYDRLTSEISDHGEEWHQQIDIVINKQKQKVEKMKKDDLAMLKKLLEEMKNLLYALRQAIMENNEILQSADVTKVLDSEYTSTEMWDPPPSIDVTPPMFTPLPIQGEQLHQMFGTLTAASMPHMESSIQLVEDELVKQDVKQIQLLNSPESPSSIDIGYKNQYNIACLSPDEVWVSGFNESKIKHYTITGSLQETVTTTTGNMPSGITISKQGHLIYTDRPDRSINRVKHGKKKKIISLQQGWYPYKVCSTASDELLITMDKTSTPSRIVRYSGSTQKQVIQFDDQGEPLFSSDFLYIAEDGDKDMICVSDRGTNTVVVINQEGKLRFRYTGNLSSQKFKSFYPRGVEIDSMGQILVADQLNHCIHMVDQHGQIIRYIDNSQLWQPLNLSLDKNNTLYVAEYYSTNVKVIKYLI